MASFMLNGHEIVNPFDSYCLHYVSLAKDLSFSLFLLGRVCDYVLRPIAMYLL